MRNIKITIGVVALILLAQSTTNCKNMEKEKDAFAWQSTVTAPYLYPVQVLNGGFYKGKEWVKEVPSGQMIIADNWGHSSGYNNGSFTKLPDGLGIEWFSFAENKFYSGSFDLPYDTIKKLFNTVLRQSLAKDEVSYDEIRIGMAPEGIVIVWVYGDSHCVDIGRFQAHEIPPVDLNRFLPSSHKWYDWTDRAAAQKEFADMIALQNDQRINNLKKNGLSPGLYDSYRKKYNVRITPNFADKSAIIDEILISNFSGEADAFSLEQLQDTSFHLRAPLDFVAVTWSFGREVRSIEIKMDESELFSIYKQMYADDPNREIELRIDISEKNNDARAYFSEPGSEYPREIELEKSDIGIYPLREGHHHWITAFKDEYESEFPYKRKDGK